MVKTEKVVKDTANENQSSSSWGLIADSTWISADPPQAESSQLLITCSSSSFPVWWWRRTWSIHWDHTSFIFYLDLNQLLTDQSVSSQLLHCLNSALLRAHWFLLDLFVFYTELWETRALCVCMLIDVIDWRRNVSLTFLHSSLIAVKQCVEPGTVVHHKDSAPRPFGGHASFPLDIQGHLHRQLSIILTLLITSQCKTSRNAVSLHKSVWVFDNNMFLNAHGCSMCVRTLIVFMKKMEKSWNGNSQD